jgi:hypothetical protein
VTSRQLNAEVLFAAIDRSSSPSYASTSRIRRTGYPAWNMTANAVTTSRETSRCTTSSPPWTFPSNPQWEILNSRRSWKPMGHPRCHEWGIRSRAASSITLIALRNMAGEPEDGASSAGAVGDALWGLGRVSVRPAAPPAHPAATSASGMSSTPSLLTTGLPSLTLKMALGGNRAAGDG